MLLVFNLFKSPYFVPFRSNKFKHQNINLYYSLLKREKKKNGANSLFLLVL